MKKLTVLHLTTFWDAGGFPYIQLQISSVCSKYVKLNGSAAYHGLPANKGTVWRRLLSMSADSRAAVIP
jgi:hypothetical protein